MHPGWSKRSITHTHTQKSVYAEPTPGLGLTIFLYSVSSLSLSEPIIIIIIGATVAEDETPPLVSLSPTRCAAECGAGGAGEPLQG